MSWEIIALILSIAVVFVLYAVAIQRNAQLQKQLDEMFTKDDKDSDINPVEHESKEVNDWYIGHLPKDNYNGGGK